MTDLTVWPAAELARRIREGSLASTDVTEAFLSRIEACDAHVQAYISVLAEQARGEACTLDRERRRGRIRGLLHGVPVAIKDLVAVAGIAATAGSSFLGTRPSERDAPVVRRIRDAGGVILGTTTLNEFALGTTGVNPHAPTARNPWNLGRITGGSSSGSGAAIAARLAAAAIGTDTGGSIRIPAALCGIVGLKPTFGRVSRRDVTPLAEAFDTVGPMVRTVEDAALLLEVIAGPDHDDPACSDRPAGGYLAALAAEPVGRAVGRLSGPFFESDLDPAVAQAMDDVTRVLVDAGFRVEAVRLPTVESAHEAQLTVLRSEAAAFHQRAFPDRLADYSPDVRAILAQGAATPPQAVADARSILSAFQGEVDGVLRDCPLLIAPAVPVGAPRIVDADPFGGRWQEVRRQMGRFTRAFNATGLPTIALPVGLTAEGLPVGVQVAAPAFEEASLLTVARRVEQAIGFTLPDLPRLP